MRRLLTIGALAPLIIAAFTGFVGFAPAAPVPDANKRPPLYHPLQVGATSVYDRGGTDETVVVTRVERKDDGWLVARETSGKDGTKWTRDMVHVSPAGVLVYWQDGNVYSPPLRVLKVPAGGAGWAAASAIIMAVNSGPTRVAAKYKAIAGGKVKVGAGTFETVKVDSTYKLDGTTKVAATSYFADGVGLVKLEIDGKPHSELKTFTPGKD